MKFNYILLFELTCLQELKHFSVLFHSVFQFFQNYTNWSIEQFKINLTLYWLAIESFRFWGNGKNFKDTSVEVSDQIKILQNPLNRMNLLWSNIDNS